jgi:heptosyltransferase-1
MPEGTHVAELNYSLAERAGAMRPALPEYPLQVPAGGAASMRARLEELGIAKYVVVAPGASWRAKAWPPERYAQFCRDIELHSDFRVVIVEGPGEQSLAEKVRAGAAPANPVVMRTTIEELMGLLAHATCVVAVDSGPLHLAAALGAQVVGLFGPTDSARNGPFAPGAIVISDARPDEISYKRRAEYSPAMLRISVAQVLDATLPCLRASA